jgi:PAS domain S-box-containing protein
LLQRCSNGLLFSVLSHKINQLKVQDFSKLFSSLPGFFLVVDTQLVIVAANDRYLDLFHHQDKIIGKSIADVLPFTVIALENVIRQAAEHTESFADKSEILTINFTPIIEGDEVSQVILKIENLAGVALNQPSEFSELFANLFDLNPAALAISRISDSKVLNVNESLLRLLEFDNKRDVIGKTAAELNLMTQPEKRDEVIRILREKVRVVSKEGEVRTFKGKLKWVATSLIIVNLNGEQCLLAVLIDITDRKRAEDEIRSINSNLERSVIEKTKQAIEAELEYRSVVEQAMDGIFISDSKGNYFDVNASACAMLGYSKAELLTMSTLDILAPDESTSPPRFTELMLGKTLLTTRTFRRKDGSLLPVEISGRMLSNGKMLGIVRDITERKRAEDAAYILNTQLEEKVQLRTAELEKKITELQESEDKFQKAFHASSAGLTITKLSDSKYVDANDAFLKMIGYSREEVIDHTALDLSLVVDIQKREAVLKAVRDRGAVSHVEMTIKTKTGEHFEILSSIETIAHHGERYAINIIYDITDQKRAQQKLEAVNKELESFSYSVSHDLRAPLRSIMGYAEILQLDFGAQLNETMNGHLRRITNSAKKMGRLIDDLLEFSRLGKLEVSKSNIDTLKIIQRNIHEHGLSGMAKPQFVLKALLPSYADFSMLNQVWFNLISNAVKYSSKKENPIIEIGSYEDKNETVFYIRDNGVGFNMEFSSKLFGVFQRLHRAADFDGTGVGLALVKRIIDKHDGRIWAEAIEEDGATFYFSLPSSKAR